MRRRRGIALVYALWVTVILSALTAAVLIRFLPSLRAQAFNQGTVRSRMLADSAAELALVLMRDDSLDWYRKGGLPYPVTSQSLGYTDASLGGTFDLRFEQIGSLYPNNASYLTVLATGYSGRASAHSAVTVKLTSPLTNYVYFSNGSYNIEGWGNPEISGPLFVNANGDAGDISMWHDIRFWNAQNNREEHASGHIKLASQFKATGNIYIRNSDYRHDYSQAPKNMDGNTNPGNVVHDDITGVTPTGKVELVSALNAQANIPLNVDMPEMPDVLDKIRKKEGKIPVDVTDYPDGVLAEFSDGKLYLSKVEKRSMGKVFDKDVWQVDGANMANAQALHSEVDPATADRMVRTDVAYDDPDFPNAPYPPDLVTDIDGDGTNETEGDYFEVNRVVRGEPIATIDLSRDDWKTIYLTTSRTDYTDAQGKETAPPLYLRGNIKGKVSMVYDVTDDRIDPNYDKLHTVVLDDHEDPDDSPARHLPGTGPGIPGGLRYDDPNIKTSAQATVSSPDAFVMVSRGTMGASGEATNFKDRMRDADGNLVNYSQHLRDLDQQYVNAYSGKYTSGDLRMDAYNQTYAPMSGVFIANKFHYRANRVGADGNFYSTEWSRKVNSIWSTMNWGQFPNPPPGTANDKTSFMLLRFRSGAVSDGVVTRLKGAISSLGSRIQNTGGVNQYDYKFQELDSTVLADDLGLPVTLVVCSWQRY